ncbi:LETM1-related biofilm-associated protein [Mangrovimonas futianensis]|uniref:LETM1-related biofilm-associated protein n=1 Tax=Mangrovimonas futianensis TaxID=2895523 RepID=UPI001E43F7F4|nr:LETM1-related biofilm-associated protein [Mangrovimonas futianensis]MCF1422317.1 LETM1-related biofilm-associated protein [Mangrovimonas futianensis]
MNPSSKGWIKKLTKVLGKESIDWTQKSPAQFYDELRTCGFIYGSNIEVINNSFDFYDYTEEELCKINLALSFYYIYKDNHITDTSFLDSVIQFYKEIDAHKPTFFTELLGELKSHALLEHILHKRVLIEDKFIGKSFNYFVTNALLFTDVLAYQHFLKRGKITNSHLQHLEAVIESIVLKVLDSKVKKSKYDDTLIDLLERSLRFQNHPTISLEEGITFINEDLEKYYIMDLACMAAWTDMVVEKTEQDILKQLGIQLNLPQDRVENSLSALTHFYQSHKEKIGLLSSKNIVQTFYSNSSKLVNLLLKRNSKRLLKEVSQSKDLMKLITKSTVRDLTEEEQKRVNHQLMDIIKTIPSLAIFLLPGGSLLLPLIVKIIPQLLPSAFDDNRIEE